MTPMITNPVTKIGDSIRGTFLVDRPEQISSLLNAVVRKVEKLGGAFYIKNFWADANSSSYGYVGVHIKIRMPVFVEKTYEVKGRDQTQQKKYILMEIQLHFNAIMDGTLECAKEIAHNLYKTPQEASKEIPPEIIASSQLVYLTAMTRLLSSPKEVLRVDTTVQLIQEMTKAEKARRLFMATAMLLGDQESLGGAVWDDQLKAIVPKNKNAVATAWRNTAERVNGLLKLRSDLPIKPTISAWANTATSVDELYEDAIAMKPFFREFCNTIVRKQGCTVNFGPGNNYMIKERKSLQEKLKDEAALARVTNPCAMSRISYPNRAIEMGSSPPSQSSSSQTLLDLRPSPPRSSSPSRPPADGEKALMSRISYPPVLSRVSDFYPKNPLDLTNPCAMSRISYDPAWGHISSNLNSENNSLDLTHLRVRSRISYDSAWGHISSNSNSVDFPLPRDPFSKTWSDCGWELIKCVWELAKAGAHVRYMTR